MSSTLSSSKCLSSSKKSIAILGGGISGLSAAYYLLKNANANHLWNIDKIFILEKQSRFGGWMQTKSINNDCNLNANNHFELGPRTISLNSYAGNNVLSLVDSLKLSKQLKFVLKNSESFKKRYIVIDSKLRLLPNSLLDLFKYQPPFKPFVYYLSKDLLKPRLKFENADQDADISVHDFFEYRFGSEVADYLINPLCIGITGGDSHQLSIKSIFPGIFQKEQLYGSVVKGMFQHKDDIYRDLRQNPLIQKSIDEKWAVFSFRNGIQTLPDSLKSLFEQNYAKQICLMPNANIQALNFNLENGKISIKYNENEELIVDHLFSSISAKNLSKLLPPNGDNLQLKPLKQTLSKIETIHMAVACMQFKRKMLPDNKGFGFLIPAKENSNILGCTFDSCIFPQCEDDNPSSNGTKVTVMLGGYRFEQIFDSKNPSLEQIFEISRKALKLYLNIDEQPINYHVAIHWDCIPQYTVGHQNRLKIIENEIKSLSLPISLLGSSYYGFSVPDIILNSKLQVDNWLKANHFKEN